MLTRILFAILIISSVRGYSQKKAAHKVNAIGISVPLLWNNSNGIYYSTGNRREPSGKAISYGVNLNYSKSLYKNWFLVIGAGYFKQRFNIIRPFEFNGDTVTKLGYSTKKYDYHCFHLKAGIGYKYKIKESISIKGLVTYNLFNSFRQKYVPTSLSGYQYKPSQTNTKNIDIGYSVNLSFGAEKMITNKISIGVDVLIPLVTKWKNDEIFYDSFWGDDSQVIAENKFIIGTAISLKYHF